MATGGLGPDEKKKKKIDLARSYLVEVEPGLDAEIQAIIRALPGYQQDEINHMELFPNIIGAMIESGSIPRNGYSKIIQHVLANKDMAMEVWPDLIKGNVYVYKGAIFGSEKAPITIIDENGDVQVNAAQEYESDIGTREH